MKPSRRQLLQWVGAAGVVSIVPACKHAGAGAAPADMGFFTAGERTTLSRLSDVVIPPGPGPGGAELGAVTFIERLCSAFDAPIPTIYAGGPFSGRAPFPSASGGRGATSPPNDFATFLPLDRAMERAWRLELYGSAGVPGGGPNDAISGPILGIRDQMKQGLASAASSASRPLDQADAAELSSIFAGLDVDFRDLLVLLVHQAVFSAPEYGGNVGLGGWRLARYEGDMAPLGYSLYDGARYKEGPGAPVSGPAATPDPAPMDAETLELARSVVGFLGGREVK